MADITVHVLNFHSVWSHIHIILEDNSVKPHRFYKINRWSPPSQSWYQDNTIDGNVLKSDLDNSDSEYYFHIDGNPDDIVKRWKDYWQDTEPKSGILSNNCAVAAQWFLNEFAHVPEQSLTNISYNHLAFGIIWPSFIPCPVTLPGRIMSNATFHLQSNLKPQEKQEQEQQASVYMKAYVLLSLSLAILVIPYDVVIASIVISLAIIPALIAVSVVSGYYLRNRIRDDTKAEIAAQIIDDVDYVLNSIGELFASRSDDKVQCSDFKEEYKKLNNNHNWKTAWEEDDYEEEEEEETNKINPP